MKLKEFWEKIKSLCRRAGKKTLIAACAVLVLGCTVALNFILRGRSDENVKKMALDLSKGSSQNTLEPAEVEDYFASITLQRKQARDEAMDVLLSVAENTEALEEAKQAALSDMNKLALDIEKEANIETLILSKGFAQCVAVINDDKCNVIVESSGLLPGDVAQISEIVYEEAGIIPDNLKIIERKESGT